MSMTWEEAGDAICGPTGPFRLVDQEVGGQVVKVYEQAPLNLRELIEAAWSHGDRPFLVYEGERYSYAQIKARVESLSWALARHLGVQKGDRVAIAMRNYPEWVISYLATLSIGAIAVPLNARWTSEELRHSLSDSTPRVLVADEERIERILDFFSAMPGTRLVSVRSAQAWDGVDRWDDLLDTVPADTRLEPEPIEPDDDATILYTSGTTGRPKGAVSTHRAVISALLSYQCRAAMAELMQGADDDGTEWLPPPETVSPAQLLAVPLFHVTGCLAVMLGSLMGGAKLVMMHKWHPGRALELIEAEQITNLIGVPTMAWDLVEHSDFATRDISSLRGVAVGGAPMPAQTVKDLAASLPGIGLTNGYGLTETNALGPGNLGSEYLANPSSVGRLVPAIEMRITDEADQEVPTGSLGEIWFRGPHLIRGYWRDPKATAETIVDGWLRTGDVGRVDDTGLIYLVDRIKDVVVRGGENVYSTEVEEALHRHPAVLDAAVFGLPDERLGEEVAAAVVLRDGESVTASDLQAFLNEHLAHYKVPTVIERLDALPRNPAGKVIKRELRTQLQAGDSAR